MAKRRCNFCTPDLINFRPIGPPRPHGKGMVIDIATRCKVCGRAMKTIAGVPEKEER